MIISVVPLIPITNHSYTCVIPLSSDQNVEITFRLTYNEIGAFWFADITKANKLVLSGLPLIPAQDMLEQYQYLGIGHAALYPRSEISSQFPNYNTLNSEWVLLWGGNNG